MKLPSLHFPSMLAALDYVRENNKRGAMNLLKNGNDSWCGCSYSELQGLCETGAPTLGAACARELEKYRDIIPDTQMTSFQPAIAGGFFNIGDVLASNPLAFRARANSDSPCAPLRVIVECSQWCDVPTDTVLERGVAVAAVVMCAMQMRPVDLIACYLAPPPDSSEPADRIFVHIDPRAIDLGALGFALAHPATARRILFGVHNTRVSDSSCQLYQGNQKNEALAELRDEFGPEFLENALYLHGCRYDDNKETDWDFEGWAKRTIAKLVDPYATFS